MAWKNAEFMRDLGDKNSPLNQKIGGLKKGLSYLKSFAKGYNAVVDLLPLVKLPKVPEFLLQ